MLLPIVAISLFVTGSVIGMEIEKDEDFSSEEIRINKDITDKQNEAYLEYSPARSLQKDAATYKNYLEQHYCSLKSNPGEKQAASPTAAEKFKQVTAAKYLKTAGKTESMSSSDYLQVSKYGIGNEGQ